MCVAAPLLLKVIACLLPSFLFFQSDLPKPYQINNNKTQSSHVYMYYSHFYISTSLSEANIPEEPVLDISTSHGVIF